MFTWNCRGRINTFQATGCEKSGMAPKRKGIIKEIHSGMGREPNPLEGPEKQSWDCRCWFPTPSPAGEISRPYQPVLVLLSQQKNSLNPEK